ncbi:MAG: uncharacterized protein KVP18_000231 [Porospora cf. gigantea A]|uniref:uncharacterized protein n=1 Tax=Porospora cf. gigantea A TaxID=2853593 RepID=UPI00355A7984|nr:MAG: hypothetical protein KVP18_000231 [Porospora cf. gigantea A]
MKLLSAALAVAGWCSRCPDRCLHRGIGYRSVCRTKPCGTSRWVKMPSADVCVDNCQQLRKCEYVTWDPAKRQCRLFGSHVKAVRDHRYISVDMHCAHPGVRDQ